MIVILRFSFSSYHKSLVRSVPVKRFLHIPTHWAIGDIRSSQEVRSDSLAWKIKDMTDVPGKHTWDALLMSLAEVMAYSSPFLRIRHIIFTPRLSRSLSGCLIMPFWTFGYVYSGGWDLWFKPVRSMFARTMWSHYLLPCLFLCLFGFAVFDSPQLLFWRKGILRWFRQRWMGD